MFTIVLIIIGILWNRFVWPFILMYAGLILTGNSDLMGQALQQGGQQKAPTVEKITVWSKVILAVVFFLLPGLWLTLVPTIILVDIVQFCIAYIKAKANMFSFNWIFSFGNKQSGKQVSNSFGAANNVNRNVNDTQQRDRNVKANNGKVVNTKLNAFRNRQRQNLAYDNNLSESPAAGTIAGEEMWLVKGAKKVYISADGQLMFAEKREKYTYQGTKIYSRSGIDIYQYDVTDGAEILKERMLEHKVTVGGATVFNEDLNGDYYFISNKGEVINQILSSYESKQYTSNVKVFTISEGSYVLWANLPKCYLLVDLTPADDVYQVALSYEYKLDISATKLVDNATKYLYQFDAETLELVLPDLESEESKQQIDKHYEPAVGTVGGKKVWAVEGFKEAYVDEDGIFITETSTGKFKYGADETATVADLGKVYTYNFDTRDKGNEEVITELKEVLIKKVPDYHAQNNAYVLMLSRYGKLILKNNDQISLATALMNEEVEAEQLTLKDLKNGLNKSVTGLKAIKQAITKETPIQNASMVKDGVYNTGAVDIMCQFGELRCSMFEEELPIIQALYVGRLVASYAINDILDKISSEWTEDVAAENVIKMIHSDLTDMNGQLDSVVMNVWVVKDEDAFYLSIVVKYGEEKDTAMALASIRQMLMKAFVGILGLSMEDKVCYIRNISAADPKKLVAVDSEKIMRDHEEVNEVKEVRSYYSISMFDALPSIFQRKFEGVEASNVKEVQSEFNKLGVMFVLRYPLVKSVKAKGMTALKFEANENMLRDLEQQEKATLIDLTAQGASVAKLCSYMDDNIFGKGVKMNSIKDSWLKSHFVIRTRSKVGFEFTFVKMDDELLKNDKPISSTVNNPVISIAFWNVDGSCVLDNEQPDIALLLFKKGK